MSHIARVIDLLRAGQTLPRALLPPVSEAER